MKNLKANIQKLGRSMLIPIAAMPFAGLALRFSADDLLDMPLIGAAGSAVFGNMDMLFAIGIALGFTKVKDKGLVALTAILGLFTFKEGLNVMNSDINMGIFAGVVTGLLASWTFNRFKDQKLPNVFSSFAKERFPLTMIMIVMTIIAVPFGMVWPYIQTGLDIFAYSLISMGVFGVGIFVFLNRLLIPLGLHHVLNSYIYFDLGTYTAENGEVFMGEIPRFLNGDPTAGLFLSGFFVVMMFGIPAICLAIYNSAKKNKESVKGAMASGAATSFITNITEPVEFSFMFIAPPLYLLHAVLAGLAAMTTYIFDVRIGFSFGASLVDYLLNFNIAHNAILIIPIGLVFACIYYFSFYFAINKFGYKTLGREDNLEFGVEVDEVEKDIKLKSSNYEYMAKKILEALGGKENIDEAFSCNTRLRVSVIDNSIVDEARIKQTGATGVIKAGDNDYQIIIGLEVTYVMEHFQKFLEG